MTYDTTLRPLLPAYQPMPPPQLSQKELDLIRDLPGLTYKPNFKQYSGYLPASSGNYLHYWYYWLAAFLMV